MPQVVDDAIRQTIRELPPAYWDFAAADTKEWTHGYHSYPAMMIPQVARSLIAIIQQHQRRIKTLFDPFMGSGTSLVEGMLAGLAVTGSDLNPLSRLLAQAKTRAWDPELLRITTDGVLRHVTQVFISEADWPRFDNLTFWFKPTVIGDLARLKKTLETIVDPELRPFFWVA